MVTWNIIPIDLDPSRAFVLTTIGPENSRKPLLIRDKHESSPC